MAFKGGRATRQARRPIPLWLQIGKRGETAVFMKPTASMSNAAFQRAIKSYAVRAGCRVKLTKATVVPHNCNGEAYPACVVELIDRKEDR